MTGRQFEKTTLPQEQPLNEKESVVPGLVGTAVDYLTRVMMGSEPEEAFAISLRGADIIGRGEIRYSGELVKGVTGLDDTSIQNACQLVGYDCVVWAGIHAYSPVQSIHADAGTIANIRIMVERSMAFWEEYGPIVLNGFTIGGESITKIINSGDGDFVTADTLWDMKVSKNAPKSEHRLQLLVYYLMGLRSYHLKKLFSQLTHIGIYNPRL